MYDTFGKVLTIAKAVTMTYSVDFGTVGRCGPQ